MATDLNIPKIDRQQTGDRNRALDIRRDDDKFVTPSITIYDIDYAILTHLRNNVAFKIEENGNYIDVPVIMASGEKWAQIKAHGYMRDVDRKILSPIIVLKRTSMMMDELVSKLDSTIDSGANTMVLTGRTHNNNIHDFINKKYNSKPSYEYYISVIPDHVRVTYSLTVWTDTQLQMNSIVEELIPQSGMAWGDAMTFITRIGDQTFDVLNASAEDRLVRCDMELTTFGILQKEYELKKSTIEKRFSIKRVVFENELEQTEIYSEHKPRIIRAENNRLP